ncbi:M3 family oligoendopeptidase [Pseudalkalibacillus hwajinpoensis]|uniref:M3 family oligoendopeptidase n=1 Tax=Guptibacillus hwajinpoensis TaxID=208199 RepID=UPI001CD69B9E|nr:M3 family oligoendopeptidase [Pseudalkalibacillus hwajinpoensis]MCA0992327.1 M3 family oligoendopeptidase [Pseudalkalibacillus hwajinpoensis]
MSTFYVEKYDFTNPSKLEEEFKSLLDQPLHSADELEKWILRISELMDGVAEGLAGHYIDFQCHSNSEEAKKAIEHDQEYIEPMIKRYEGEFDKKFQSSPHRLELNQNYYKQFLLRKENAMALFNEENIDLEVEEDRIVNRYFEHTGSLSFNWNGEEKTLSEMFLMMQDGDRSIRKSAMEKIFQTLLTKKEDLQGIMDELIQLRQKKAENVNLDNYRDYMFKKYERFDYTPEDCKALAEAVRKHVVPLKEKLQKKHQQELGIETYKPWDTRAVPKEKLPLRPFNQIEELIEGTSTIFDQLSPRFSYLLNEMNGKGALDLESRKGKAQGGFCEYLPVSELSFIFMNSTKSQDDFITLLHEMGHCIHNDFKRNQMLSAYQETPMESAELASMTMELLTMDYWNLMYTDEKELLRAKKDQLEGLILFLPSGIVVDQFQHWMYENPNHTSKERSEKYMELSRTYDSSYVDWTGQEEWIQNNWQLILHIFEVPFYYIEYVIAQLGAIQMYRQYRENPEQTLENYNRALSLGSSVSLTEVYAAAGIHFDFSETMIKGLMDFILIELDSLAE